MNPGGDQDAISVHIHDICKCKACAISDIDVTLANKDIKAHLKVKSFSRWKFIKYSRILNIFQIQRARCIQSKCHTLRTQIWLWIFRVCWLIIVWILISLVPPMVVRVAWWVPPLWLFIHKWPVVVLVSAKCWTEKGLYLNIIILKELETSWKMKWRKSAIAQYSKGTGWW